MNKFSLIKKIKLERKHLIFGLIALIVILMIVSIIRARLSDTSVAESKYEQYISPEFTFYYPREFSYSEEFVDEDNLVKLKLGSSSEITLLTKKDLVLSKTNPITAEDNMNNFLDNIEKTDTNFVLLEIEPITLENKLPAADITYTTKENDTEYKYRLVEVVYGRYSFTFKYRSLPNEFDSHKVALDTILTTFRPGVF